MNGLIVRVLFEGKTYDLDVADNIPLRINMSTIENTSIGEFYGIGSQTFTLPGTKRNNRFFNHAYQIGVSDIPGFYNTVDAYIIRDGETLLQGQLQLIEVITSEKNGFTEYNVQVSDSVIQFKDRLSSKLLKDADWSEYEHIISSASIVDSWSDELLSGSIFYPLVDYGTDDVTKFPGQPRVQLNNDYRVGDDFPANGVINNINTPMLAKQFLPAIKLKDVVDVIFEQVGFTYTSEFLDTDDFNKLYVLPKAQEGLGVAGSSVNTLQTVKSDTQLVAGVTPSGGDSIALVQFNSEISDPGDNYNTSTYLYTTPIIGDYSFSSQITFVNPATDTANVRVTLQLINNFGGTETLESKDLTISSSPLQTLGGTFESGIAAGLTYGVQIKIEHTGGIGNSNNLNILNYSNYFNVNKAPSSTEGVTVDMSQQWDATTKSIDFIQGLIEQFNLILYPDAIQKNLIHIEPFNDWVSSGEKKDWTEFWNVAEKTALVHTVAEQPKEILLKNADDSDRFSKLSVETFPNFQYGTQRVIADNTVSQGKKSIGSFFAPVILGSQTDSASLDDDGLPTYDLYEGSTFVLPHLYKFENNKQTSYKFKPRIGYKNTLTIPNGSPIYIGVPDAFPIEVTGSYATISNYSDLPVTESVTKDLHFNNEYAKLIPFSFNPDYGVDNFTNHWQLYIDSIYWEGASKLTLDVKFNADDYKNIQLNDQVFIKNQRYRINKIEGFNVTHDDVATVELLRLFPSYYALDCNFDFEIEVTNTPTPTATSAAIPTPTPTITPVVPTPTPTATATPTPTPTANPIDLGVKLIWDLTNSPVDISFSDLYYNTNNLSGSTFIVPPIISETNLTSGSIHTFDVVISDTSMIGNTSLSWSYDITSSILDPQYFVNGTLTDNTAYEIASYFGDGLPVGNQEWEVDIENAGLIPGVDYNALTWSMDIAPPPTPTATPIPSPTPTPTISPTPTPSATPGPTPTPTAIDRGTFEMLYNIDNTQSTNPTIAGHPRGTGIWIREVGSSLTYKRLLTGDVFPGQSGSFSASYNPGNNFQDLYTMMEFPSYNGLWWGQVNMTQRLSNGDTDLQIISGGLVDPLRFYYPNIENLEVGLDYVNMTSSVEIIELPQPNAQFEFTIELDETTPFDNLNIDYIQAYWINPITSDRENIITGSGFTDNNSTYTFKYNGYFPTSASFAENLDDLWFDIIPVSGSGWRYQTNSGDNQVKLYIDGVATGTPRTYNTSTCRLSGSTDIDVNSPNSSFPLTFATASVHLGTIRGCVDVDLNYYRGTACEYPFGDSQYITSTSSIDMHSIVKIDVAGRGFACYEICEEITPQTACNYYVVSEFEDCTTCLASL